MRFKLPFRPTRAKPLVSREDWLPLDGQSIRLCLVANPRARRYVLRLREDGVARVTIPRGGSAAEARRFVERNEGWLKRQLLRHQSQEALRTWTTGTEILVRGERVRLEPAAGTGTVSLLAGNEVFRYAAGAGDLRPQIEKQLRGLAGQELPARVLELAGLHGFEVRRVSVRNQRTRWGSCSRRGTISLNWRLVQAPVFVRDYIILHELAHLRHMNHSVRFWREVERLCPTYAEAETWLKQNAGLLR